MLGIQAKLLPPQMIHQTPVHILHSPSFKCSDKYMTNDTMKYPSAHAYLFSRLCSLIELIHPFDSFCAGDPLKGADS